VQRGTAANRYQISFYCQSGNPGQALVQEDKDQIVSLASRHLGVDQDVLELAGAAAERGSDAQAGPPVADAEAARLHTGGVKVHGVTLVTAGTEPDHQIRWGRCWGGQCVSWFRPDRLHPGHARFDAEADPAGQVQPRAGTASQDEPVDLFQLAAG
jgi:hypothetical protein